MNNPRVPLLHNRMFVALQIGGFLSGFGDQVGAIALYWAVMTATGRSLDMGLITLLLGLPGLLSGMVWGELLDRWSKRWVIFFGEGLLGGIFYAMGDLFHHTARIDLLYGLTLLAGLLAPLMTIGSFVMLPDLIGSTDLLRANTVNEVVTHLPIVLGPLVAGWLMTAGGAYSALRLAALSFWFTAALLFFMKSPLKNRQTDVKRHFRSHGFFGAVGESMRSMIKNPVLRWITLVAFVMNVAYGILVVSLPILVHDQLRTVPAVLGSTWAAYAIGMMAGSSGYHILRVPVRKSIMVGMVLAWGSVLLLSGLVVSAWSLIAGLGMAGVVFGPYPPIARTLVQAVVPPEDRGRIFSVRAAVLGLGTPLGGG
ncbi:major facilitator superfamily MFS_1 [Sulfobacillus acidophilus TPY]|uniref:Major facilitator superfamily MFS_1 n=1 Tax=Sulfobacillus acidophilus (strain ATCC 700253 / DSM 10332 / NAL) TaxID=679936 RepID=G8TUS1_SULAD|nr:major facilitator superfamily MFS_1 [Sulfobacillus acidophilus TPY]AEW05795.1 major facilitator superfamily MFS_1 [Sulfobacillus acidophilus DSM 10332]